MVAVDTLLGVAVEHVLAVETTPFYYIFWLDPRRVFGWDPSAPICFGIR